MKKKQVKKIKTITRAKVGAPTKYVPAIFQKVEEYLNSCGREQTKLPTIEGLASYLDITRETIYQWNKKYPEFSDTLKKLLQKQKQQLMDDGMYGGKEVNAAMAIFLLKSNHGMKEDPQNLTQINIGNKDDKNQITFVNFSNEPKGKPQI